MKTKMLKWVIATLMFFCMAGPKSWAQTPIPISSAAQLRAIETDDSTMGGSYVLTQDIDLADVSDGWIPIGMTSSTAHTAAAGALDFTGTLDGQGFAIKNLTYTYNGSGLTGGLFGRISGATIKNLELRDFKITGSVSGGSGQTSVGALAAVMSSGCKLSGISVIGCTLTGYNEVGGIAGRTNASGGHPITECYIDPTTKISGTQNVGGFIGNVSAQTHVDLTRCYNAATMTNKTSGGGTVSGLIGGFASGVTNGARLASTFVMAIPGASTTIDPFCATTQIDVTSSNYFACNSTGYITSVPSGHTIALSDLQIEKTYTDVGWDFDIIWSWDAQNINIFPILLPQPAWNEIYTADDLIAIGKTPARLDRKYKLMQNIDLSGSVSTNWLPIGMFPNGSHDGNGLNAFTGTLDGQGYAISNLTYTYSESGLTGGVFGRILGTVQNLELRNFTITGTNTASNNSVGALTANLGAGSTIENVAVIGCTLTANNEVGGIVGRTIAAGHTIKNCYVDGTTQITGKTNVGGLIGFISQATSTTQINNCYVAAKIQYTGTTTAYGLIGGYSTSGTPPVISITLKANFVMAQAAAAGSLQPFTAASIINASSQDNFACSEYFPSETNKKPLSDLRTQATYAGVDWDFNVPGVWKITEGKFPIFQWQSYPALVIESTKTKTISDYVDGNYGDIIFVSDDDNTGQLDLQGKSLTVTGVVKLQKPFTKKQWYPVGFPFDVASVRCDQQGYDDYDLLTYNPSGVGGGDRGDYWLKTCKDDGTGFDYYASSSPTIAQGGYILQVPSALDGSTFTFTSKPGVVLSNPDVIAPTANGYQLTYNPSVANFTVTNDNNTDYFYVYDVSKNNFSKDNVGSGYDLKPFESAVVANGIEQSALLSSMNIDGVTALPSVDLSSDKAVATEYYNLLGVKVLQPVEGNIYLVKTIFESGRTSVVKQFIRYN